MNKIRTNAVKVKNHVARNKVAYAMTTVSVLLMVGHVRNFKAFDKFLNSKGIDPMEFHFPEMFEEMNPS